MSRRLSGAGALTLMLAAIALAAWPLLRPPEGRLRLTVLDVGQGDAIVVEAPDGRALLIDAGPGGPMRLDTGERVVAPYLWNRGHLRLAKTIVTDPDADHAGGMGAIRRLFGVAEPWDVEQLARGPHWFGGAMLSLVWPRWSYSDSRVSSSSTVFCSDSSNLLARVHSTVSPPQASGVAPRLIAWPSASTASA